MRRGIILVLLFLGMQLILPLSIEPESAQTLLKFGFLILAAYTVGEVAESIRLPKIVGYMLAGVLFGPDVFGTVSVGDIRELAPVSGVAIALIAFLAGAELRWAEVRERGTAIIKIMSTELLMTFVLVAAFLLAVRQWVPFLSDMPIVEAIALIVVFASITIVHSPAVTMALLTETHAKGPVARTTLGIVLLSDVAVVLLFSGALALARALAPVTGGGGGPSLGMLTWEIGGSFVVGALLGGVIALYLRFVQRELLMFGVVVTFLGAEIADLAHVETLLTLLVAGFVTENFSRGDDGETLRHAMERASAPVFVVFFALAGAAMRIDDIATFWVLVLPIVIVRAVGIWGGTKLGARWANSSPMERRYVWPGLISQAGVAIGLAAVVAQAYPDRGPQIASLFLAVLAVNQTAGPILFRNALANSGEIVSGPRSEGTSEGTKDAPPTVTINTSPDTAPAPRA
ncbi:MAG: cation:proton antiporter [Gemmatimonadaceae bacterium]